MKEYSNIEELLERYYNAQTSEAEEQRLREYFIHEETPPHLQKEKEMFLQLQAVQVPEGLEEKLSKQIDQWAIQERFIPKSTQRRHGVVLQRCPAQLSTRYLRYSRRSLCTYRKGLDDVCPSTEQGSETNGSHPGKYRQGREKYPKTIE